MHLIRRTMHAACSAVHGADKPVLNLTLLQLSEEMQRSKNVSASLTVQLASIGNALLTLQQSVRSAEKLRGPQVNTMILHPAVPDHPMRMRMHIAPTTHSPYFFFMRAAFTPSLPFHHQVFSVI
jgi:hypothetical protein